jgi:site-specific DNA recombinase
MRKPARVLAYARVSSRDQGDRGTSLDGQRERIAAWCVERGFPAPDYFVEVESGGEERREKRAELERLLKEARTGDLVVTILVDRWTRDVVAGVQDVRALLAKGAAWYAIEESIDASTDEGISQLEARAAGAAAERRRIRRRTVGARNRSRDQGLWVEGHRPLGYQRGARAERRHLILDVVPEEARLVRETFERSAAGQSLQQVADWLNVEKGTDHDRIYVARILRNRVYLGEVRDSRGVWIRAQWEPLVTRELFERAHTALVERRKGGRRPTSEARTASWLLRGLGSCPECGYRMSAAYSRLTDYYACGTRLRRETCSAPYVRVDHADAEAAELALRRLVELRLEIARPEAARARPADFAAQRAKIAAKIARAERGYVEGVLSAEALRRERERLDAEIGRLEVVAGAAAAAERARQPEARRAILAHVERIEKLWSRASVEKRRTAMAVLAKSIRISPEGVSITWRELAELSTAAATWELLADPVDVPPDAPVEPPPRRPKRGRR